MPYEVPRKGGDPFHARHAGRQLIRKRQFVIILGISLILVFAFMFDFGNQGVFSQTAMKETPDRGAETLGIALPEQATEENVTQNVTNSTQIP